jgi:hypothetical protein
MILLYSKLTSAARTEAHVAHLISVIRSFIGPVMVRSAVGAGSQLDRTLT